VVGWVEPRSFAALAHRKPPRSRPPRWASRRTAAFDPPYSTLSTQALRLSAVEFIRRLLWHVLPTGLQRIRHYGILANRHRRDKLALCRELLGTAVASDPEVPEESREARESPSAILPTRVCPVCGAGRMVVIRELPPGAECAAIGSCSGIDVCVVIDSS
jgi:hypothetical protein